MRPSILNPLFASISSLKGVGPGLEKTLSVFLAPSGEEKASEARVVDPLFHLPSGFLDRRRRYLVRDLPDKGIVTLEVTMGRHKPPPPHNRRIPYRTADGGMPQRAIAAVSLDRGRGLTSSLAVTRSGMAADGAGCDVLPRRARRMGRRL